MKMNKCALLNPKLRFKGFSGEWNSNKSKYVSEIFGAGVDKLIIPNERLIKLVNFMDVFKNTSINNTIQLSESSCTENEYIKYNVKYGDILLTPSSEDKIDIGISSMIDIENTNNIVYSYHLNLIRFKSDLIFPKYIAYYLRTYPIKKYFYKVSQGATRYTLSKKDFELIPINYSSILEQTKIAKLFTLIDKQIDLLVHKLQLLEVKKKYLWKWLYNKYFQTKKSKLLDILKIYDGYPFKTNLYNEDGKYKIITIKNISNNGMIGMNKCNKINDINSLNENLFIKSGDVICAITGAAGFKVCLSNDVGLLNQRLLKITSNTYSNNIILFILENNIELITSLSTGSQMNISKKDIENILIPNIEKGSLNINNIFFEEYNLLLLKLKNKINLIKSRKLYFLNKMFI